MSQYFLANEPVGRPVDLFIADKASKFNRGIESLENQMEFLLGCIGTTRYKSHMLVRVPPK